jgi:hypothetical protein
MRKLLTIHGGYHPKADIYHLFVPRKQGGRSLMQLEEALIVEMTKLVECVDGNEDPLIQIVRMHQHNINLAVLQTAGLLKSEVQRGARQIKGSRTEKTKERWRAKRMHGRFAM